MPASALAIETYHSIDTRLSILRTIVVGSERDPKAEFILANSPFNVSNWATNV